MSVCCSSVYRPLGADGAIDTIAGSYRKRCDDVLLLESVGTACGELPVAVTAVRLLLHVALPERAGRTVLYRISAGPAQRWMRLFRWRVPRRFDDRHAAIAVGFPAVLLWTIGSTEKIERCKDEAAHDPICREVRHAVRRGGTSQPKPGSTRGWL